LEGIGEKKEGIRGKKIEELQTVLKAFSNRKDVARKESRAGRGGKND